MDIASKVMTPVSSAGSMSVHGLYVEANHPMRNLLPIFLFLLIATPALAGTCPASVPSGITVCKYVDYVSGADTNTGDTEASPWKHAPGMTGCAGGATPPTCQTESPTAGHGYILKGGSVWDYTTLPWTWAWSGSGSTSTFGCRGSGCIYIGIDPTWNQGTVNEVYPTKDYGGCPNTGMTLTFSGGNGSNAAATLKVVGGYGNMDNGGYLVASATVTNPGSGYTSNPTVNVVGGSACHNLVMQADIQRFIIGGGGNAHPLGGSYAVYSSSDYVIWDNMDLRNIASSIPNGNFTAWGSANNQVTISNSYIHNIIPATFCTITATQVSSGTATVACPNTFAKGQVVGVNGTSNGNHVLNYSWTVATANSSLFTFTCGGNCPTNFSGSDSGIAQNQDEVYEVYFYNQTSPTTTKLSEMYNSVVSNGEVVYPCTGLAFSSTTLCTYGTAVGNGGTIYNSKLSWSIWLGRGAGVWHDNDLWANTPGNGGEHTNMFYTTPFILNATNYIYNNVFHDNANGSSSQMPMDNGMSYYIYNNVCWLCGAGGAIFSLTNNGSGTTPRNVYFWNNTFLANYGGGAECINGSPASLAPYINVYLYNNHCITDGTSGHWFDMQVKPWNTVNGVSNPTNSTPDSANVVMTQATAASQGYCKNVTDKTGTGGATVCLPSGSVISAYYPTSSSASTVTFSGTDLASTSPGCGTATPYSLASLCSDILGNSRLAWQSGAYYRPSPGSSQVAPPTGLSAAVQ